MREKDCSSDAVSGLGSDLKAFSAVTGLSATVSLVSLTRFNARSYVGNTDMSSEHRTKYWRSPSLIRMVAQSTNRMRACFE